MSIAFLVFLLAQNPEALFQSKCANCHSAVSAVGAPLPEALRQMSWQSILAALETGKMSAVGSAMTAVERESIAKTIGKTDSQPVAIGAKCSPQGGPSKMTSGADWNGWADPANTRFQPAQRAGLTAQ